MMNCIHSLIIPTRNRQRYVPYAVRVYLESPRNDIQVVVLDNSDDPAIIKKELGRLLFDKRLLLIESEPTPLSMRDNWERGVAVAKGEWLTYIGDDDACDPNLVNFVEFIHNAPNPPLVWEAIGWKFAEYSWPETSQRPNAPKAFAAIPLDNQIRVGMSKDVLKGLLSWNSPQRNNGMGPSLYHGAIKRSLIDRIISQKGRLFDLETVDFDTGYSILLNTDKFLQLTRPFTIMGSSIESNSASVNTYNDKIEKSKRWINEVNTVDGFDEVAPPKALSIAIHLWHFNQAWMKRNNFHVEPIRLNYVKGIEQDCSVMFETQHFNEYKEMLVDYLNKFGFSDLINEFNPIPFKNTDPPIGLYNDTLFVDPHALTSNIEDFAKIAFCCTVPWNHIGKKVMLNKVK